MPELVADVARLGAYFERDRYGIIGHSMGGYVALKAGVADPHVAVVVSIAGNPDWTLLPEGTRLPPDALPASAGAAPR